MEQEKKVVGITCNNKDCGKQFRMYAPEKGGVMKVECPYCKATMKIDFGKPQVEDKSGKSDNPKAEAQQEKAKKPTKDVSGVGTMQKGKLVQKRGLLYKNIEYALHPGNNIIGRYDEDEPSMIQIKGDPTISRRSVNIKMNIDTDSLCVSYIFCLQNAKNPVVLNDRQLGIGEELYLKFGDTFTLGRTTFRFVKA